MKRALLVGLDEYEAFGPLAGCVNDVAAVEPLLARNADGSPNFNCQRRTSQHDSVTRDSLLADCAGLLAGGADIALLYFAGHGVALENDVALATQDGTRETPGVRLSELLEKIGRSTVREVIIVLDSCFSGAAGSVPQLGTNLAALREGVSILAASRSDQAAAETPDGRGAFSTYVCGGLDGGAADVLGRVTLAGLYAYLDESFGPWDQRPVFKANVDRLQELRVADATVSRAELRRLTEFFSHSGADFPLDPSYEPEAEPENDAHQADFAVLQRYRSNKLVEPVDADHMYFAAMNSTACRLTPLGEHYWHMAQAGLL